MAGHGSRQPTIRRLHLLFRACGAKFDTLAAPRLAGGYTLTMSSLPASSRSKTSSLTVKLPESVVGLLGTSVEEAARHLVELAVIEVFRQGKLSGGKAAALLGLSRAAWLDLLARHDVPHAVVTEDSLEHDLRTLANRKARLTTSSPTPGR